MRFRASSNFIITAVYYGGATLKQRDMNKIKKAIRSLNPVIRMTIIAVLAAVICITSGLFFGRVLGINSATALFVLALAATFFVVGVYVRLIEDDDD